MEEGPEPQEWVERAAEEHHQGHEHDHAHAEGHAPEGAKPMSRASAITAAVLAVLAATGSLFSGHAATQAILAQSKATNQWAYFQAKSTKGHVYEVAGELVKALSPAAGKADDGPAASALTRFGKEVARYNGEKEEIQHAAEKLEDESREELHKHHRFATGVAMLQVGIVLASVSILIRYKALYILSLVAGAVGVGFLLAGLVG
jgi:Domain of unknown function (DUF4337)